MQHAGVLKNKMCLVRCAYWKMCMCVLLWKEIHVHFCLLHLSDTLVPENTWIFWTSNVSVRRITTLFIFSPYKEFRKQNLEIFTKRANPSQWSTKTRYQDFEKSWTVRTWLYVNLSILGNPRLCFCRICFANLLLF